MRLKISQRDFRSGDLLIYITSRLIWYVWYVMQAKCWWPYLGHKINSQFNRVWHNTLPPYAASRWLCYLFIAIPTSQGMPTNMIEIFPFITDRVDIMCSVHILSADTTQRRWRPCYEMLSAWQRALVGLNRPLCDRSVYLFNLVNVVVIRGWAATGLTYPLR